jgi:hypothetical protein
MSKTIVKLIGFVGISTVLGSQVSYAATHTSKTIHSLQVDTRACAFFTLDGVSVADSTVSSAVWFALPKSASNFAEMNAMLLSAKLSARPVSVSTDGTSSCGYATVTVIWLD